MLYQWTGSFPFSPRGIWHAGLLLGSEREVFEQLKTNHSTYWMPLVWASSVASRARKEGRIRDDFALKTIVDVRAVSFRLNVKIALLNLSAQ